MKLHRFFVQDTKLTRHLWLREQNLINQWIRVMRFGPGQEVVLFDGKATDRLYRVVSINKQEAELLLITELEQQLPKKNIYLLWSLLKKDKNDWVLQKCTELGASHFLPIISERTEKTGFDVERAQKIVMEASEQCGRSNVPSVREPIKLTTALDEFNGKVPLLVCQQGGSDTIVNLDNVAVLIGPEGGWTDAEKQLFQDKSLSHLNLYDFTLRAETAAVAALAKLN